MDTSEKVREIAGYVTVGKAAHMLGVSEQLIRLRIANGELAAIRIGDRDHIWLIDKDSVLAQMDAPRKKRGPAKGCGGRPKKSAAPS
jgi:hypothetical protein